MNPEPVCAGACGGGLTKEGGLEEAPTAPEECINEDFAVLPARSQNTRTLAH